MKYIGILEMQMQKYGIMLGRRPTQNKGTNSSRLQNCA